MARSPTKQALLARDDHRSSPTNGPHMTAVLASPSPKRNTTSLLNARIWAEIQRSALAIADQVADQSATDRATPEPSAMAQQQIAGMDYLFRRQVVRSAYGHVILVAIERCSVELMAANEAQSVFGLTRTEALVATLLAERKSNREIADGLRITQYTARRHTEHVLKKIGVHRRTEIGRALANVVTATATSDT